MRRFLLNATTLFAAFALSTACSPPPADDAGTDAGNSDVVAADRPATDVPHQDVAADAPSNFGQCTTNAQCGAGGMCLTTFPGGLCTRRCTNDRACGTGGMCEPTNMICLPTCTSGGGECDPFGGACVPADQTNTTFLCLPSCSLPGATGTPAGFPSCPAAMACDAFAGICTAMPTTMGADDGAPCTMDSDCKGKRCILENDPANGGPSGFLGGYCISFGRLPNLMPGTPALQGSCPTGATPVPFNGLGPGDDAPCFKVCAANSDCRPGYQCDHLMLNSGMNLYTNGVCFPVNCNTAGMACPTGYRCVTQPSDAAMPPGQCEAIVSTDAGVDVPMVGVDVPPVG